MVLCLPLLHIVHTRPVVYKCAFVSMMFVSLSYEACKDVTCVTSPHTTCVRVVCVSVCVALCFWFAYNFGVVCRSGVFDHSWCAFCFAFYTLRAQRCLLFLL